MKSGILTREQAMDYLGIGKDFLARLTKDGDVPSFKIGKYRRYRQESLDQFLENNERRGK